MDGVATFPIKHVMYRMCVIRIETLTVTSEHMDRTETEGAYLVLTRPRARGSLIERVLQSKVRYQSI